MFYTVVQPRDYGKIDRIFFVLFPKPNPTRGAACALNFRRVPRTYRTFSAIILIPYLPFRYFFSFFFIHARFRIRGELPPNRKFRCFPKFFICTTMFLKSIPTFEAHRLRRIAAIHNWTSIVFLVDALTSASRTYIKRYSNSNPAIFRIVNTDERSSLIFVLTANGKRWLKTRKEKKKKKWCSINSVFPHRCNIIITINLYARRLMQTLRSALRRSLNRPNR